MPESAKDADTTQQNCVELPSWVSVNRSMVSIDGSAVDGYVAQFIGIQGVGHDEEEAVADLFSEIELAFGEFDGIVQDAAAMMDGAANDLETADETPVEIADRLRDDARTLRARSDDV